MKRKLLSVFLALCMTLTLVPAASAYSVQDDHGAKPDGAKFQVDYHTNADGPIKTRFFDNEGNDDWGGEDGKPGDHFWDPITLMNDDPELEGYTKAVITLSEDITLTDTTILVANGHDVTINGDGHTITCILTGSVGNNPGSEHVAGQDAIYIGGDNEENKLTLRNVSVEIKGPQAEGITNQIGNKDTQGIYNDGELHLYEGAKVMVDGVSQNGINGSGTTFVCDKGTILDVRNVGGSGIEGRYVSLHDGAAVTVNNTGAHGLTVVQLDVTNASVTTTDTILYGVISNLITLKEDSTLSATCAEDAEVPAPIRVLGGGKFDVAASATVIGTAWADNVTGDGRDNVNILTSAATIGNTKYATLKDAVNGATENDIIRLCRDVTLTEKLTIDKEIILDGSGQTIIGQKNSSDVFLEVTGNDVTLQNLKAKDFGGSVVVTQGNTNLAITGCTFGADGAKVKNGVSMNTGDGDSFVTMLDTTIAATDAIVELTPDTDTGTSTVNIESGYYTGGFKVNPGSVEGKGCDIKVSGGYFTADPTSYLTEQKAALVSDNPNYIFVVKKASANAADVVAGESAVDESLPSGATKGDEDLAKKISSAIKNATTAPTFEGGVSAAANEVANDNDLTGNSSDVTSALSSAGVLTEGKSVSIVIQPYMDISITKADSDNNTFTLDITPMYRTIATTAGSGQDEEIKLDGNDKNAALIGSETKLTVTKPVAITLPLPSGFVTGNNGASPISLFVKHVKDKTHTYFYRGSVANDVLTFINPHGFSEFTISGENEAKAEINGVGYASLQDAINDVADGGTIKLLANGQMATVSREITFTVAPDGHTATITAGSGYQMTISNDGNTYTFTKKSGSSGGGGGTSTPTYTVTTGTTSNGTVTVNPKNPTKGSTVTVNVTPNDGYQLDTLTVTDANGKKVEVKKKTDTEYTFTMPASKVTVSAAFVEIPEEPTPSVPQFTDVSEGAWYYDAVRYVCEKGMMNGVAEGVFAPNSTTNRAMIVTILYRLENEPAASGSSFTDVPSGQWYSNAVAWAAANGIVNGVTDTTFAPNRPITREQMAAILYRYAAWKGCDVSGQIDLSGYTDAASVSTYAKEALAWANAEGLITGVTGTTLRPAGSAVRSQVATILMRLCENVLA